MAKQKAAMRARSTYEKWEGPDQGPSTNLFCKIKSMRVIECLSSSEIRAENIPYHAITEWVACSASTYHRHRRKIVTKGKK